MPNNHWRIFPADEFGRIKKLKKMVSIPRYVPNIKFIGYTLNVVINTTLPYSPVYPFFMGIGRNT